MQFTELDELDSKAIQLPYLGDRIVMDIILPNQRSSEDTDFADGLTLTALEEKLKGFDVFDKIEKEKSLVEVHLEIPKFKIESEIPLVKILKRLRMTKMFQQGVADFKGISDIPLYVSEAIQKAFIEVDETGTEAAAPTVLVANTRLGLSPPELFLPAILSSSLSGNFRQSFFYSREGSLCLLKSSQNVNKIRFCIKYI